jgi:hypothetical protein
MGWAAGFSAGSQLAKNALDAYDRVKARRVNEQVGLESQRYGVTEGAYGPELSQNIEQLRGLQAQDPGQAAVYEQSIKELTRRQGLTAPDFSVGSRAQNFGTREEAEMAAKPMRTQGMANVYRQAGEIEKADELLARADQQKLTGLQTRAAEMTVKERERAIEAQQKLDSFEAWRAENPNVMGSQLKDVARSQFKLNDDQLLKVTSTITGLAENDLKQFQLEMKNAIKGKDLKGLAELYNTDDRLDPNTDLKVVRGKNGAVTLNFVDKQGNPISSQNFSSEALATAFLNKQATEPDQVAEWLLGIRKTEQAIDESRARGENYRRPPTPREQRDRVPTPAEITARANMYLNSDQTGELTAQEAVALAERDLGVAAARPGPTDERARLVDMAISGDTPAPAPARAGLGGAPAQATPAGQQFLGLYNTVVPPARVVPQTQVPVTSQDRLRGFYVPQQR